MSQQSDPATSPVPTAASDPGTRAGRWWARALHDPKWRLVALVFVACKVAAPLIVLVAFAMFGQTGSNPPIPTASGFSPFAMWFRWDSQHYLKMVTDFNFFTPLTPDEHALMAQSAAGQQFAVPWSLHRFSFAPLYTLLVKLVSWICFGHAQVAMLVVSNVAFLACLALTYDLAKRVIPAGSPRDAVILLALAPTGFLLQAGLTESTFVALVLAACLLAERRRWGWVVLFGAAAALTRSMGFLIALPLLLILWRQNRYRVGRDNLRQYGVAVPALLAPPVAWAAFMAYCRVMTGDWLAYNHLQWSGWNVKLHSPLQWVPHLAGPVDQECLKAWLILAVVILLAVAVVWLPPAYTVYTVLFLVTPLMAGLWWQSILRYLVVLFPLALVGALILQRFPRWRGVVFATLAVIQALLLIAWNLPWTYLIV